MIRSERAAHRLLLLLLVLPVICRDLRGGAILLGRGRFDGIFDDDECRDPDLDLVGNGGGRS